MSRTQKNEEKKKKTVRVAFYLLCLFVTATSVMFAKIVNDENTHIKNIINTSREIPLSIKEELGLR